MHIYRLLIMKQILTTLIDIQETFGYCIETRDCAPFEIENKWNRLCEKEREQWYKKIKNMNRFERLKELYDLTMLNNNEKF